MNTKVNTQDTCIGKILFMYIYVYTEMYQFYSELNTLYINVCMNVIEELLVCTPFSPCMFL